MADEQRLEALERELYSLRQQISQMDALTEAERRAELYRRSMQGIENMRPDFSEFMEFVDERLQMIADNEFQFFDKHGLNPDFMKRFPNKIVNSGFEWYDEANDSPMYWTGNGVVTKDSNWEGTVALVLEPGQYIEQGDFPEGWGAGADPAWWQEIQTRVSFKHKGGVVRVRVRLYSDDSDHTLTDNSDMDNIVSGSYLDYPVAPNWEDGHRTFYFMPIPSGGRVKVRFENVDPSANVYLDAVQMEPDFTGRWPSFYTGGPRSTSLVEYTHVPIEYGILHGPDDEKPELTG